LPRRSRGDETHFKPGFLIFQSEPPHVVSYVFSSQRDNPTIARRFNAGSASAAAQVPPGRLIRSSLRDLKCLRITPGIEMPGYCQRVAPRRPNANCPKRPSQNDFGTAFVPMGQPEIRQSWSGQRTNVAGRKRSLLDGEPLPCGKGSNPFGEEKPLPPLRGGIIFFGRLPGVVALRQHRANFRYAFSVKGSAPSVLYQFEFVLFSLICQPQNQLFAFAKIRFTTKRR